MDVEENTNEAELNDVYILNIAKKNSSALLDPEKLLDEQRAIKKEGNIKGSDEAKYIARHSSIIKKSAQEYVFGFIDMFFKIYDSLSPILKILYVIVWIFTLIIMLPTGMGVMLTVSSSQPEMMRAVTLFIMFVVAFLAWILVKV
jgi:hypothetical protein